MGKSQPCQPSDKRRGVNRAQDASNQGQAGGRHSCESLFATSSRAPVERQTHAVYRTRHCSLFGTDTVVPAGWILDSRRRGRDMEYPAEQPCPGTEMAAARGAKRFPNLELLSDLHRSVPCIQMHVPYWYRLTEIDYGKGLICRRLGKIQGTEQAGQDRHLEDQ